MARPEIADVFYAIGAPIRREIIHRLALAGILSITTIAASYDISRQAVTRHIQVLEKSGVVQIQKDGREQLCQLNGAALKEVYDWVRFYDRFWDDKLDALGQYLDEESSEV